MRPHPYLSIVLALIALPSAALAQTPTFMTKWGTTGSGLGQFWIPWDVAVDRSGNVYVSDFSTSSGRPHRIQKFTATGLDPVAWGSQGSAVGQFDQPRGLAFDSADTLYVCDARNSRIQKITTAGVFVGGFPVLLGTSPGEPYDVALDQAGNVYIADLAHHAIHKYDARGGSLGHWGGPGAGEGQLDHPLSLAVGPNGTVYVADNSNHRVQTFSSNGAWLGGWGSVGSGAGEFTWPRGIHVDDQGFVYVTDQIHRVQKFTADGAFVHQFGTEGILDGQFEFPTGLASIRAGTRRHLYVVDTESHRIQMFGDDVVPAIPTTWGRIKGLYRR